MQYFHQWNIFENVICILLFILFRQVNTLMPRQNDHQFADHIFKFILLNEGFIALIQILLYYVPSGSACSVDNQAVLVQIMAWYQPVTGGYLKQWWPSLMMHICVTWPQCVNSMRLCDGSISELSSWVQVIVCHLVLHQAITWTNAEILSIGPLDTDFSQIVTKTQTNSDRNMLPWFFSKEV